MMVGEYKNNRNHKTHSFVAVAILLFMGKIMIT